MAEAADKLLLAEFKLHITDELADNVDEDGIAEELELNAKEEPNAELDVEGPKISILADEAEPAAVEGKFIKLLLF